MDNHEKSLLAQCRVITLDRHRHERGSLTVVQNDDSFPFQVKRVFYIYDVPVGSERGGHSHHELQQLIVAVSGSFTVTLTDGRDTMRFTLNRPYQGLYVAPGIWSSLDDFSSGSISLVLASDVYEESDYVRDYDEFLKLTASKREETI